MQDQKEIIRIPAIVSDIDGVLILGHTPIKEATDTISLLQKPLSQLAPERFQNDADSENMKLPFVLLTNGGGMSEDKFVDRINNIHSFNDNENAKIRKEQLILNYTPLKHIIQSEYQDKIILIGGRIGAEEIIELMGSKKYITINEYLNIYPQIAPIKFQKQCEDTLNNVSARLNITQDEIKKQHIQISAIFLVYDPDKWEEYIQLITDILTTNDGQIAESTKHVINEEENHIPLYCTSNDLTYKDTFRLPRIVFGCFNIALQSVYELLYNRKLVINQYGKPSPLTYAYTKQHCQDLIKSYNSKCPNKQYEISQYYMIGDNPASDIQGANNAGWVSILVRTGVFKNGNNSEQYPAKFVCDNIQKAVEYIFEQENIH